MANVAAIGPVIQTQTETRDATLAQIKEHLEAAASLVGEFVLGFTPEGHEESWQNKPASTLCSEAQRRFAGLGLLHSESHEAIALGENLNRTHLMVNLDLRDSLSRTYYTGEGILTGINSAMSRVTALEKESPVTHRLSTKLVEHAQLADQAAGQYLRQQQHITGGETQ
jgi:hypothetical protein